MDDIDESILAILQQEGRLTNQELADRVGLSPSPCLRRVRSLEASGVIAGYGARLDRTKYGLPVTVFVRLRMGRHAQQDVERVESGLAAIAEVVECHLIAGEADYLLKVVVASLDHYEQVLRAQIRDIPGVTSIETSFAMATVKEAGSLPPHPRSRR